MITSKQVCASHIVGGEITYTRTSAGVYTVTLTMYRDCSGIGFPSTVSVLGSDPVTDSVFTATSWWPGFAFDDPIVLSPDTTFNVPPTVNADCVTGIPNFCVEKRIYTGTWTFTGAAPNGIVFEYETCCRNSTISNITSPGSASMTYLTTVFPAGVNAVNSTPEFTVDPPTVVAAGLPTTVNFSATDADGDSLFYEWADALDQNATVVNYSSGYSGTNPLPSSPAATVNGADGTISANLNLQGQFVISIFITEFRNGVPLSRIQRDYQFNIASFSVMDLVVASAYQPVTCTDSLGDVGVTVNFGTPPYVYSWSTGATTAVVNDLPPGTYTVDVVDALGCEDSLSVQVIEAADLQSSMTYTDATCDVIGDATANASVLNSAGGPYTFTLNSTASPSGSWTNLDTGQYNMVIQDTNGYCIVDSTFSIVATNSWNTAVLDTVIDLDCWDGTTGQIQISGTNSTHNYTWTDGTTGASRTNMGPGDFSLYVLDPNSGCSDSIHAQVQAPDTLENDPYVVTDATCLAGTDGSFTTFVQGGTPPMTYTINGANYPQILVVSTANGDSVTVPNLSVGTYQFTAIDANGCDIKDSITIDAPATWYNFTLRGTGDLTCYDDSSGMIVFDSTGTINAITTWDDGFTRLNRDKLNAGNHTLYITHPAGCSDTMSFMLSQPPELLTAPVITKASCGPIADGSIVANASGGRTPYTYDLSGSTSTNDSLGNLNSGTYLLTISDSAGLCSVDTSLVVPHDTVWHDYTVTDLDSISCFQADDGEITVSGTTTGLTFLWNDGSTDTNRTGLAPATYELVIGNGAGCRDTLAAVLNEPTDLVASWATTQASCLEVNDGTITFSGTGGTGTINYFVDSTAVTGGLQDSLFTGTYGLYMVDANGCVEDSVMTVVADTNWHKITVDTINPISCSYLSDAYIGLAGNTAGLTIRWSDLGSGMARNNLAPGSYSAYITNGAGCADTLSRFFRTPDTLYIDPLVATPASCLSATDGTIVFTGVGGEGALVNIFNGAFVPSDSISGLATGTYTVEVKDTLGCSVVENIVVPADTIWHDYSITALDSISCFQADDGEITVSGTTTGLTFLWNDGSTDTNRTGLAPATYELVIGNGAGCRDTLAAVLNEPTDLVASWATTQASCLEVNDGTITFNGSGGTGAINYFVDSTAVTGGLQDSLFTGTYGLYMVDANGCVEDSVMTVVADTNWHNITIDSTAGPTCSYTNDAYIELAGNTSAVTIRWSDLGSGGTRNNLAPGPYSAYITNGAGCADTLSTSFATPDSLYIDPITSTPTACLTAADGTVSFTAVGGEGTIAMLFNGVATSVDSISGLSAGMQTIQITDSLGCVVVDSIVVNADTVWQDYNITALDSISCFQADDGEITVSGTTTGLTFLWNDGSTDTNRTGLAPAAYELVIGNGAGCRDTLAAVLNEPTDLVASWATTQASCLEVNDGTITFSGTGGTGTINYFVDSTAVTGGLQDSLFTGTYGLYMTDANGCVEDSVMTVVADTNWHNITVDTINPISCSYLSDAYIGLAGNTAGLTIRWSDLGSGMARNNLAPGSYSAFITNGAGCADTLSRFFRTPDSLYIDPLVATPASCLSATDGTIVFTGVGGEGAIVNIFNGAFVPSDSISGLATGNYTVEVKDTLGCSVVENIVVPADTVWQDYNITAIDSISCFQADDGEITVSGTTAGLTFLWNDGSTDTSRTGLPSNL